MQRIIVSIPVITPRYTCFG